MSVDRIKFLQTPSLPKTPVGDSSGTGLTADIKQALLDCFANVAWEGTSGDEYIDVLENALNQARKLLSISAVFNQGSAVIYDTDSLESLRQYLTVTAHYDDESSETVTTYTLSGTLTVGTSTITVTFGSKTTTFNVTVATHTLYSLDNRAFSYEWIDTGVVLLDEDRDYTLAMDVNITTNPTSGNGSAYRLLALLKSDLSGYTFTFGKGTATAATLSCGWMGPYDSLGTSNAGRKRVVITHSKNSGSVTCYARMDSGSVETTTVSGTFTASENTVRIGNGSSTNSLPTGTINKARIYDTVLSIDQINEFLGV